MNTFHELWPHSYILSRNVTFRFYVGNFVHVKLLRTVLKPSGPSLD